jgi:hypothetical protein
VAALSSLPPPQRAVLSLVLEKGRSYADIAGLLQLDVDAVRERARLAIAALGGGDRTAPAPPPPERRAAIGDYLLGQQPDTAAETRAYLAESAAARDWARAVTGELARLDAVDLPTIPADPPAPVTEPPAADAPAAERTPATVAAPVSRRGGALLLAGAGLAIAAVVLAVVLLGGRGGSPHRSAAAATPAAAAGTATPPATPTTPPTTTPTPAASVAAQITLTAAAGTAVHGLAAVIKRGSQRALAIAASGLHPTSAHLAYGVWLFNSRADSQLIGYVPPVKADGKISAAAALPTSAGRYHRLVLTEEAGTQATQPGRIVLSGPIPAGAAG